MTWTQAICGKCFDVRYPGHAPVRVIGYTSETCCDCGRAASGIYVRIDPATVKYPSADA